MPQEAVIRFKTRPAECDLIISAFSALEAVAEAPLAVLAVDVDGDDFFFDGGSRVLGSWGGVLGG
jgi:uncharacterized ParB-like nuclease family protein